MRTAGEAAEIVHLYLIQSHCALIKTPQSDRGKKKVFHTALEGK